MSMDVDVVLDCLVVSSFGCISTLVEMMSSTMSMDVDVVLDRLVVIGCDGRGLCLMYTSLVEGVRLQD